ncbi:MAG TPA: hypothetical protein VIF57_23665 [Polyangia bacterium]
MKSGWLALLALGVLGAAAIHRTTHGRWFARAVRVWPAHPEPRAGRWVSWNPIPIGPIKDMRGERPDDVWAWSGSAIMHWEGRTWTRVPAPPRDFGGQNGDITSVGESSGVLWARTGIDRPTMHAGCVVYGGSVAQDWCRRGEQWKKYQDCGPWRPGTYSGTAPPAPAPDSARVDEAELARLWAAHPGPDWARMRLKRGYRVGGGELWAVDETGRWLAHFDGRGWTVAVNPALGYTGALWLASEDDGWAAGGKLLYRWDGREWSAAAEAPEVVGAIWGSDADDVWAVGAGGLVMHFDGRGWLGEQRLPGRPWLTSVAGRARDDVWVAACDYMGFTAHWSGARWTPRPVAPSPAYAAVHNMCPKLAPEAGGRALVAVDSAMFAFAGVDWRDTPSPLADADRVPLARGQITALAPADDEMWAVGWQPDGTSDTGRGPLVLRRRGDVWEKLDVGVTRGAASALWARAFDDVWVVGTGGLILHFDGRAWTREESGTDEDLAGIHGAGDTIWILGVEGGLLRRTL